MRLKVDPEHSLTPLVAGKTRYNFIEMIISEKNNFRCFGKYFDRVIIPDI